MKTVIVRLLVWAVVSLALAFGAAVVTEVQREPSGDPKAYQVDRADVDVEIQSDASLVVTENLTFAYDGSFSGAYRDIPLAPGVSASDVSVSDREEGQYRDGGDTALGSLDDDGLFGTEERDGGRLLRIVWHYDQQDGERTFKLRYRVRGAATAYDDVLVVPWAPWGDQWNFWLNHLTARIHLPKAVMGRKPEGSWVRSATPVGKTTTTDDGVRIELERSKPQSQVGFTIAIPRSAVFDLDGAQVKPGNGLDLVRKEEEQRTGRGALEALANVVWHAQVPLLLLLTALLGAASAVLYRRGREYDHGVPEHLAQPPSDQPPAAGYALAHEGGYDQRVVLATLLDLVDRGYYVGEPTEGKELDLRLAVSPNRPDDGKRPYETKVLEFFDGLLELGGPCALGELADRIPKHDSTWRSRWEAMNAALEQAGDDLISWDRDLRPARALIAVVAIVVYALILGLVVLRSGFFAAPVAGLVSGLLLLFLFPANWLRRRDPDSIRRGAEWAAFAKWTKDYPSLDDDPPATLALWRRVLVYGVAFGTAERVIKSGKIPAPLAEQDTGWSRGMMHGATYGALSGSSFGSGFSSQVAPKSSSSSSGGGGGGGFSGGGGGGAW